MTDDTKIDPARLEKNQQMLAKARHFAEATIANKKTTEEIDEAINFHMNVSIELIKHTFYFADNIEECMKLCTEVFARNMAAAQIQVENERKAAGDKVH